MRRSWAERVCQFRQQRTRRFHSDEDDVWYDVIATDDEVIRSIDNLNTTSSIVLIRPSRLNTCLQGFKPSCEHFFAFCCGCLRFRPHASSLPSLPQGSCLCLCGHSHRRRRWLLLPPFWSCLPRLYARVSQATTTMAPTGARTKHRCPQGFGIG